MTTPVTQPHGRTASRPGPLKQRLMNAISLAEEAKSLNRKERLKQLSFEALYEGKKKSKNQKRIRTAPAPSPEPRIIKKSIEMSREKKKSSAPSTRSLINARRLYRVVKPLAPSRFPSSEEREKCVGPEFVVRSGQPIVQLDLASGRVER